MSSRMKFVALSAFMLFLAACSSGAAEPDGVVPSSGNGTREAAGASRQTARLEQGGERALSVQMQLILGTLQLETTDLAVDSRQSAELVPLWKALRSLSNSDTAAEAEIEAVINQIQDTMTAEQIEAIAAQELSPEDMQTIIQDLGLEFGPPEGFEGFEGGDFPIPPGGFAGGLGGQGGQFGGGGGRPGGAGAPPGGLPGGEGDFDPEAAATARAEAGFAGFGGRVGGFLMDPLIEMLEQRAGLESTT